MYKLYFVFNTIYIPWNINKKLDLHWRHRESDLLLYWHMLPWKHVTVLSTPDLISDMWLEISDSDSVHAENTSNLCFLFQNLSLRRCGAPLMELSETSWEVPCSGRLLSVKTYPVLSLAGNGQSSSAGTRTEIRWDIKMIIIILKLALSYLGRFRLIMLFVNV